MALKLLAISDDIETDMYTKNKTLNILLALTSKLLHSAITTFSYTLNSTSIHVVHNKLHLTNYTRITNSWVQDHKY